MSSPAERRANEPLRIRSTIGGPEPVTTERERADYPLPVASEPAATGAEFTPALANEQAVDKPRHFACFDGLRAIAAILVLLLHTSWASGFTLRSSLGIYLGRLEIGVSIFFLISGFLLYRPFALSHLSGLPPPDSGRFWARRLLRIVPAYWLALTVLAYLFHVVAMGAGWQGVASHYLFLQIYFPNAAVTGIPQAWSLCTEMSFYLFLPLYAAVIGWRRRSARSQLRRELLVAGVLIVVSILFRVWVLHIPIWTSKNGHLVPVCTPNCATDPPLSTLLQSWLPAYLDLFALGMILAVTSAWYTEHAEAPRWLNHRLMPWASWVAAAAVYWAVSHVVNDPSIIYIIRPHVNIERQELYGLFALLMLLPAVFGPQDQTLVRKFLRCWPMASLGVISYGIYLWHLDLVYEFFDWTGWHQGMVPFGVLAGSVLGISIAFSSVSYFGLERPILRYKSRLVWWNRSARRDREVGSPSAGTAKDH
jgi:peptidoglycan/LPS O-acetylase OafA/YrhL